MNFWKIKNSYPVRDIGSGKRIDENLQQVKKTASSDRFIHLVNIVNFNYL